MKGARSIFHLVILIILGLQGCQPLFGQRSVPQTAGDVVITGQPAVRSVEVVQSEVPRQVLLVVQAVLPNTCLRLGEAAVDLQGKVFTISLPGEQSAKQGCQAASVTQERIIRLEADTLAPGSYIVLVNGTLSTFRVTAPSAVPVQARDVPVQQPDQPGLAESTVTPEPPIAPDEDVTPTSAPPSTEDPALDPTITVEPPVEEPAEPVVPTVTAAPPLPLAVGEDPAECTNKAALYSTLTVPDGTPFEPGETFTKTWLVMNVGSCTWGPGYQLVFAGGDPLGAPQKVPLPSARPRQIIQVAVQMTAPVAPQSYESSWAFETPDGYVFGLGNPGVTPLTLKVSVVARPVGVPAELDCGALRLRDMEQQVLGEINTTRAGFGLYPLELVEDLSQVALKHSLEMACFDRDSHWGRDGMLYNVRLQRDGILFSTSNEILYSGNGGPKGSITWWMGSSIHKPIVLSTQYTQVGIAYVYYDQNTYKQRIAVNFIHP